MKTNVINSLRQYAKVARTFPKMMSNGTNARIRSAAITPGLDFQAIKKNI